jgi:acyl carrier protein
MSSAEEDELLDIIADESVVRRDSLVRSATLDQLGLDSITYVSLGYAVEEKYGVTLELESLKDVVTLGELLDRVTPLVRAAKEARSV